MYTDNVLNADPRQYTQPRSWFSPAATSTAAARAITGREDIQLLTQMVCNDLAAPAAGVAQLLKGLRAVRDSGAHWLGVFANDLLVPPASSTNAANAATAGLPANLSTPVVEAIENADALIDEITATLAADLEAIEQAEMEQAAPDTGIEEVVLDEWPVADARSGEDQHYRTVDGLAVGAMLVMTRDDGRPSMWRIDERCPKTLSFTLVDTSGKRRLLRTRSGLAAELRRGACHVVVEQVVKAGLLSRLANAFGLRPER